MGISLNTAALLKNVIERYGLSGALLTLGEQSIGFDRAAMAALLQQKLPQPDEGSVNAIDLFHLFGFSLCESLDISPVEGPTHIIDLNAPETPGHLVSQYNVVLNGGTLEHVFHAPNALANITRFLRPGGVVIHILPCNNWVDHGYYQFSPVLMHDYYRAAGYELLESMLIAIDSSESEAWLIESTQDGMALTHSLDARPRLILFVARRPENAKPDPIPQQAANDPSSRARAGRWFPAYRIRNGLVEERPVLAEINLVERMIHDVGQAWSVSAPEAAAYSDMENDRRRSSLIILEDGVPMGPGHALHDEIRKLGGGRFSHWGGQILFSSSDGYRPDQGRRRYVAILHAPVTDSQ